MSPSKLLGKLRENLKLAFHTNGLPFLFPTYIYSSTSLPEMLYFECDPLKNIRELSPFGYWYLGLRKVKYSPFEKHSKKLNRLAVCGLLPVSLSSPDLNQPQISLQTIKTVAGEFCAFLMFNFYFSIYIS